MKLGSARKWVELLGLSENKIRPTDCNGKYYCHSDHCLYNMRSEYGDEKFYSHLGVFLKFLDQEAFKYSERWFSANWFSESVYFPESEMRRVKLKTADMRFIDHYCILEDESLEYSLIELFDEIDPYYKKISHTEILIEDNGSIVSEERYSYFYDGGNTLVIQLIENYYDQL